MKHKLFLLLTFFFLTFIVNVIAAPYDTGFITFFQPDETEFIGRIWGDEFIYWAETEEGYCFVHSEDGWYYYAQLDEAGEYTKTEYKVGIDDPPSESYQLERSQERIDEISAIVLEFNEQRLVNREWFMQKQADANQLNQPATISIGIILIKFPDVPPYGYNASDFDSMMFSENYWYEPNPRPGFPSPHPENEAVFGSFRDYWKQMSKGNLIITGKIVNHVTNDTPNWLLADSNKSHYVPNWGFWYLAEEAYQKALDSGLITTAFDKYFVIYAGEAILNSGYAGGDFDGQIFFDAERSGFEGNGDLKGFTHIGVPLHEFAHTIGMEDEYNVSMIARDTTIGEDGQTCLFNFDLMARGEHNGPNRKGACPATLSPYYRILYTWLDTIPIDSSLLNLSCVYNYSEPVLYKIIPKNSAEDEHYIFESRGRNGFDLYIPSEPSDSINQPGRLLIWQHKTSRLLPWKDYHDRIRLKSADNVYSSSTQLNDFFPGEYSFNNYQSFNDTTDPCTSVRDWHPLAPYDVVFGNFALNGIQKISNNNTLIEGVFPYYAFDTLQIPGLWQTVSVPVIMNDSSAMSVLGTSTVYKFSGGYHQVFKLDNGVGYWAKFSPDSQTIIFGGTPIDTLAMPVDSGWNLKGSIFYDILVSQVYSIPAAIIQNIYKYENGYVALNDTSILKPGIGYWIKTNDSGTVYMEASFAKLTSTHNFDLAIMDKFTLQDAEGNKQVLYVTNTDIDTNSIDVDFEMPPYYSELPFDSRFGMSDLVKKVNASSGIVDLDIFVHTLTYPVTISWELNPANGITYSFIGDSILGKLNINGMTKFDKLNDGKIRMSAKVDGIINNSVIPREFQLYQNYPNPFNPSTKIKYAVAEEVQVNLSIYNILGQKIAELINETMKPGNYEAEFNASSFASGVYLYTLQAGDYLNSKKMILIK